MSDTKKFNLLMLAILTGLIAAVAISRALPITTDLGIIL